MPIQRSPYYNFALSDTADGADVNFLTWRTQIAGTQTSSNFMIVDSELNDIDDRISQLQQLSPLYYVTATRSSPTLFVATNPNISSYINNMVIIVSFNDTITGQTSLNINSLGNVFIQKYDTNSNLVNLQNGDLRENKQYFLKYDQTNVWVVITAVNSEDINIIGNSGNISIISSQNVIEDSGVSIDMLKNFKGYFVDDTSLQTAIPTGISGDYAIVEDTTSVWIWDNSNNIWVNTYRDTDLSNYYTKQEIDTELSNYYDKTDSDSRFLNLSGGTMTGNVNMSNNFLLNYGHLERSFNSSTSFPVKIADLPSGVFLNKIIINYKSAFNNNLDFIIGDGVVNNRFVKGDDSIPQEVCINEIIINEQINSDTELFLETIGTATIGNGTIKILVE